MPVSGALTLGRAGGLAQHERRAAGLDLDLAQVTPLEDGREPIDEGEQRGVALVADRDGLALLGHCSHRLKMRAAFWPPKPNELDSPTRTSRCFDRPGVRSRPAAASSGCSRLIVGGMQPVRMARIV